MFDQTTVNINGNITAPEKAQVSVFDRGFLFGDSIYEATLCRQGKALFLSEHVDRLYRSAEILSMSLSFSKAELTKEIYRTIQESPLTEGLVRFIVTRGVEEIGLLPGKNLKSTYLIIYKPLPHYPEQWYRQGTRVLISKVKRNHPDCIPPMAKTGNYLNNILAGIEAHKEGFDDALMLNLSDHISEGTTNNFWFVKDDELYTPSVGSGILDGITRRVIFELAKELKIVIHDTEIPREQLHEFSECFLTSSTKSIVPVAELAPDWKCRIVPGPLTKTLMNAYHSKLTDFFKR